MRSLAFLVLVATSACMAHDRPSPVRDPLGRQLPTTALLDADTGGSVLHCTDGSRWTIVERPRPYMAGTRLTTARVTITDAPRLCDRIRAADH